MTNQFNQITSLLRSKSYVLSLSVPIAIGTVLHLSRTRLDLNMILAVIILIVAGVSIKYGKQYFLIAGYNTMSATKKAKYDIKRIADLIGNVLIAMALIILIGYFIAQWLGDPTIEMLSINIAVFLGVPYLLIMSNTRNYKLDRDK